VSLAAHEDAEAERRLALDERVEQPRVRELGEPHLVPAPGAVAKDAAPARAKPPHAPERGGRAEELGSPARSGDGGRGRAARRLGLAHAGCLAGWHLGPKSAAGAENPQPPSSAGAAIRPPPRPSAR